MSYEQKYLKYKEKYLNLKASLYNNKFNTTQMGGKISDLSENNELPDALTDTPVSEHSEQRGGKRITRKPKIESESSLSTSSSDSDSTLSESSELSISDTESVSTEV